ncbi:hypothetical protein [Pedobacter sp.]|uniref:hypothetical protein n=1 Tax=Pedobacter sp. TaxID=1411316 RepID=UPI0031D14774
MQARKRHFLKQLFATLMLGVFALAITPWSALHHHEENIIVKEKHCTHTVHVKTSTETCLICKAHFEKNFTTSFQNFLIHLKSNYIKRTTPSVAVAFTEIIASCLRGPPIFS